MNYGFVKVCAATLGIKVADVRYNANKIISAIKEADGNGAQIVVFPELSICGYTCGDLFNQCALIESVEEEIAEIAQKTKDCSSLCFIGAPVANGGKLYNCAVAICAGEILGVVPKSSLPNYGEFYERRHFYPADCGVGTVDLCGITVPFGTDILFKAENSPDLTVACEICEDLWVASSPSIRHALAGATVVVNLSCSDEVVGKAEYRRDLVKIQSAKLLCGYVYCDAGDGESTTDLVFAGHNLICENGVCINQSALFENGLLYGEIDVEKLSSERRRMAESFFTGETKEHKIVEFEAGDRPFEITRTFSRYPFVPASGESLKERAELILTLQSKGLEKRVAHTGAKTAVIGISGGLDSALALLVARRAFLSLGKPLSDIVAITMPGFGTTSRTKDNSLKLISLLGASGRTIDIKNSVDVHFADIGHDKNVRDVTYENAQARMRTMILMDIANETGGMVVGTGDLSELALGWATYNGDHMSMYGVNSSVPKTLVKYLVGYEAENIGGECGRVLKDILSTEISPELLPPDESGKIAQKTEDIVGPYSLTDFFMYYSVRWGFSPEKIAYLAQKAFKGEYDGQVIMKWLKNFYKRFFSQQFKRSCVPDGVKVGTITLSPRGDWRMPSDAEAAVWLAALDEKF